MMNFGYVDTKKSKKVIKMQLPQQLTPIQKITKSKIKLLSESPFFGYLVLNLNIKEDNNMPMPTACVDAFGNMFFDSNFINKLDLEEVKSVICHETLHICLFHLSRLKGREPDIWNVAVDVVVQNLLQKNDFKMIEGTIIPSNDEYYVPMTKIHIKDISKKSAEQIYEELQPLVKMKEALREMLKKILDGHKFSKEEKQLTPQEKEIIKRWRDLLVEATEIGRQKGDIPAGIERYVKTLLEQKLDWRSLLYKYIVRELPMNYSYNLPSKKTISSGYFVPSIVKENINIVASIDTSGSIQNSELQEFLSEIIGIAKAFDSVKIKLIICDAKVQNVYDVENGSIGELLSLKMKGGGGTSHIPVKKFIEDELPNTKLWIAFTDGFSDIHRLTEPNFNVIWVISKNGIKQPFHFGETIFLEE